MRLGFQSGLYGAVALKSLDQPSQRLPVDAFERAHPEARDNN